VAQLCILFYFIYLFDVQALDASIAKHESELLEVMRLGDELRQLASGDDVARLDSELDSISVRYVALRRASEQRLKHMMEVPAILQRLHASHETVVSLVRQIELELEQRDVQPGPEAELHLQVSFHLAESYVSVDVEIGAAEGTSHSLQTLPDLHRIVRCGQLADRYQFWPSV